MLTCSSGGAGALLRPSVIMSSLSSSRKHSLLVFSLKQCVHKKLTTFQQCVRLSSGTAFTYPSPLPVPGVRRKGSYPASLLPGQVAHCCSLNLNNHHITFHYINSSIFTSTFITTHHHHQQHQPRSFIHHQSSSAPSSPPTGNINGSKFITTNSTSSTTTNDNGLLLGGTGVVSAKGRDQREDDEELVVQEENEVDEMLQEQIWSRGPALTPTFNVGAYANDSENVKKLLQLGVDLSKWEPRYGAIPLLYKSNFETTMEPIIKFLLNLDVEGADLSRILTVNPFIFKEQVNNLKMRVDYLKVKKFEEDAIRNIITRNPYWLSFSVPRIDRRLGFFQTYFGLTGDQVRRLASVGSSGPKLITYHLGRVKDVTFTIKEEMGFTSEEIVKLLLTRPKIWKEVPATIRLRFDYLHNEEKFSHADIARWPMLLLTRERRMKERIGFLRKLGRAQFDPTQPNYISPERLCYGTDAEWATDVARVPVAEYNNYLKTL